MAAMIKRRAGKMCAAVTHCLQMESYAAKSWSARTGKGSGSRSVTSARAASLAATAAGGRIPLSVSIGTAMGGSRMPPIALPVAGSLSITAAGCGEVTICTARRGAVAGRREHAGTFSSARRGDLLHHARLRKNPYRRRNAQRPGRGRHRDSTRPQTQALEHRR